MRKKYAMRLRRDTLRRGAEILSEGMVFSKRELHDQNLKRKDNGYCVKVRYKGSTYNVADDDMLKAYKLLSWCMDVADEDEEKEAYVIGGICLSSTGKADWMRD